MFLDDTVKCDEEHSDSTLLLVPLNVVEGGSGAIERLEIVSGDNSDDTDGPRTTAL